MNRAKLSRGVDRFVVILASSGLTLSTVATIRMPEMWPMLASTVGLLMVLIATRIYGHHDPVADMRNCLVDSDMTCLPKIDEAGQFVGWTTYIRTGDQWWRAIKVTNPETVWRLDWRTELQNPEREERA